MSITMPSIDSCLRRSWLVLPLLVVTWWAVGCSTPITKQARESIQSVSLDKNVTIPAYMTYTGRTRSVSALIPGIVGAVATGIEQGGARNALAAAMQRGQIDVGQIAREQFAAELGKAGIFPSIVPEGGDAQVTLEVQMFGFGATWAFSTELRPTLGVKASLVRNGSVVWQRYESISSLNGETPKHYIEDYLETPDLIRQGFESVAKLVAAALVNDMRSR
jgi:hypothetical protein